MTILDDSQVKSVISKQETKICLRICDLICAAKFAINESINQLVNQNILHRYSGKFVILKSIRNENESRF